MKPAKRSLTRTEIEQRRQAGKARAASFTREYQCAARAHVQRESLVRAGKAGYAACSDRVRLAHQQRFANWRRHNPSALEAIVMGWLDELGFDYIREFEFLTHHGLFFDFNLLGMKTILEVDGEGWHSDRAPNAERRRDREKRKAQLLRYYGFRLIHLSEASIRDGSARAVIEALWKVTR